MTSIKRFSLIDQHSATPAQTESLFLVCYKNSLNY